MANQRRKHHFWRDLLVLIVLFGLFLCWDNSSIETDEVTFSSVALPAGRALPPAGRLRHALRAKCFLPRTWRGRKRI